MSKQEKNLKEFLIKARKVECLEEVIEAIPSEETEVPASVFEIIKKLSLLFLEEKEKNLRLQQQLIRQPINCQAIKEIVFCNN